jgi:AraC family transcriptional regulator, regulatory protein of adaptative response / DNA-3-methyladenine glycosylase II
VIVGGDRHHGRMVLDHEQCYRAVTSRDSRFDGYFVGAVRTTGIYCRPSCPAVTPKRANIEFFPTAAAAHEQGYRACKRCRPDASPGSPEWDTRGDVVARAMRLIGDGVVDRDGVSGLARRLHYSDRHLNRVITDELGAGPLAIARAQRATTARVLIETSTMPFTAIAFAAGFRSIRQFNDTVQKVFAASPSQLRAVRNGGSRERSQPANASGTVTVDLAVREPFDLRSTMGFLASRAIPGVEHVDGTTYRRAMALPNGHGIAVVAGDTVVKAGRTHVRVTLGLADWRDLAPAVRRVRRLFDLDADPVAIDAILGGHPLLAELVARRPGLRVPGSVDPFETVVRAVIGQQVSVSGARTIAGRIVRAVGTPLAMPDEKLTHVFPSPAELSAIVPDLLPMPMRRRATLVELANRIALGKIVLDAGADRDDVRQALLDVPGIGPWTADYVLMRGLGDPDVFLDADLGVRQALAELGSSVAVAEQWRPWRSYAVHHLWSALPATTHLKELT